ncbi:UDP-glucose 4-epimerase [Idiomarina aquatica]|uniref:UDP-glucose 4-epimerase n=1 Tax=Idiomarina aquatica TaxID=1327752 RepID=A0A4R6PSW2_9GAMM|nr:UDP-glucose 4-epimerase GalE [Idiomarina aquatica]TDP40217.1 UDP-glucose 4-epimerase [Idiomarina aquatica]
MKVLVTGGAGFIGTHIIVCLLERGHDVHVLDDFSNSSEKALKRVKNITGKFIRFTKGSILDGALLSYLFANESFDSVIHLAAFKAVGESSTNPLKYYENNVVGTLVLSRAMKNFGVKRLIFSSSATVYGDGVQMPLTESSCVQDPTNPYGRTKLMMEQILTDLAKSDPSWDITVLRYFNPVGAHSSGLIGEDPNGIPNNLMPFVSQVAVGKRDKVSVFGNDYDTPDGTGVRDYIHIEDLALGHVKALEKQNSDQRGSSRNIKIYNLGTGRGYSVLEVIEAFSRASGKKIPYEIVKRRPGDVAKCWADPSKSELELGWKATRDLIQMCRDAWNWQVNNPEGYE